MPPSWMHNLVSLCIRRHRLPLWSSTLIDWIAHKELCTDHVMRRCPLIVWRCISWRQCLCLQFILPHFSLSLSPSLPPPLPLSLVRARHPCWPSCPQWAPLTTNLSSLLPPSWVSCCSLESRCVSYHSLLYISHSINLFLSLYLSIYLSLSLSHFSFLASWLRLRGFITFFILLACPAYDLISSLTLHFVYVCDASQVQPSL